MSFPNPFWSQKDTEVEWFVSLELSESQASKTQADKGEAGAEAIGVEPPQRKFQSDRVRQGPTGSDRDTCTECHRVHRQEDRQRLQTE